MFGSVRVIIMAVLFFGIAGAGVYVMKLRSDNAILKANQVLLEQSVESQKQVIAKQQEDFSHILQANKKMNTLVNNLQKDIESMGDDDVLANYYSATEEGLDAIDIQDIIEDKFSVDEDVDEPKDIKKIKLAKKRELAKAKKFFNDQKDKYKVPLESSGGRLSQDQEKQLSDYKSYLDKSDNVADENKRKYEYFRNESS